MIRSGHAPCSTSPEASMKRGIVSILTLGVLGVPGTAQGQKTIPDGSRVEVVLINSTANAQPLTIPWDYDATTSPTLAPNGELVLGSFTQPNAVSNVGFRNLASPLPPVVPPLITLARTAQGFELRWASEAGLEYSPQATSDFTTWIDLAPSPLTGTGAAMTHLIPTSASSIRIYRLSVRRP